jgi:hypothetical protein
LEAGVAEDVGFEMGLGVSWVVRTKDDFEDGVGLVMSFAEIVEDGFTRGVGGSSPVFSNISILFFKELFQWFFIELSVLKILINPL